MQNISGIFCNFAKYTRIFLQMATKKPKLKTVYLLLYNGAVMQAASTLPKLVGKSLHGKSYYYYYRHLLECDELMHVYEGKAYKIQRLQYG